jgi:hypothetical protein
MLLIIWTHLDHRHRTSSPDHHRSGACSGRRPRDPCLGRGQRGHVGVSTRANGHGLAIKHTHHGAPRSWRPSLRGLRVSACLPYGTSYETSTVIKETHTNQLYYRSWSPYASQTLLEPTSTICWSYFMVKLKNRSCNCLSEALPNRPLLPMKLKKIASPIKLPCAKRSLNTPTFILSN